MAPKGSSQQLQGILLRLWLVFLCDWQVFNPKYFYFNVLLNTGDTCRARNYQKNSSLPELDVCASFPITPLLVSHMLKDSLIPVPPAASSSENTLYLTGSAGNGSQLLNCCSLRCIPCLHAEKANCKPGTVIQIKVQESCLLMPLNRTHCPTINFD